MNERKPWEQRDGEPDAAYKRFLAYLRLGPQRSLEAAYRVYCEKAGKGRKRPEPPGNWRRDYTAYEWRKRADAYDIDCLRRDGRDVVLDFIASLRIIARKSRKVLEDAEPTGWSAAVSSVQALGAYISADAVAAVADDSDDADASADVGADGGAAA